MRIFKLDPVCGQKSFYGKATVYEYADGARVLVSYYTRVAEIAPDGSFHRLWGAYSATTMKHINSFAARYGIDGSGKKWWDSLPVERDNTLAHEIADYKDGIAG